MLNQDKNVLTFQTNTDVPTDTFAPFLISANLATWEFVDGTKFIDNNTLNISARTGLPSVPTSLGDNELNGVAQDVKVSIVGDDFSTITDMELSNDNIINTFDASKLTGMDDFRINSNPGLTKIINPSSSTPITNYYVYLCGLVGNLDVSMMQLGGTFQAYNNPLLTSITNPISSEVFSNYRVQLCGLEGELDVSGLTGLGGFFYAYSNGSLTSVKNPTSNELITRYRVYGCNITGVLNVSGLTRLSGEFRADGNSLLTGVTFPPSDEVFNKIYIYNCDSGYIDFTVMTNCMDLNNSDVRLEDNLMTTAEVNQILVDIDSITDGLYTGRSIDISGNNAAPDGSSGGFDGDAAIVSLATKNITVTATL